MKTIVCILILLIFLNLCLIRSETIDTFINPLKQKKEKKEKKDRLLNIIMKMFVSNNYDTSKKTVLKKHIKIIIKYILKYNVIKKQFYLSKLNDKYNGLKDGSDLKNDMLIIFKDIVDSYMNNSIDISCLLSKSNCGSNNIKGTCGTLIDKMKRSMLMKDDLKKYKDFVNNLKESLKIF